MKKWMFAIVMIVILILYVLFNPMIGNQVFSMTSNNLIEMLKVLPAIFVLVGLLDVWVSKETMIKLMGPDSGLKGYAIAFILGSVAAGPLYAAFPIAAILLKKRARYNYVIFFLGTWSSLKLPQLTFEAANLGITFTVLNVITAIVVLIVGAFIIEKILSEEDIKKIEEQSAKMLR